MLAVAWRDLKRASAAPGGIILMLLLPLLLTGIIGVSFGTSPSRRTIPRLRVLVWDQDRTVVSRSLASILGQERVASYVEPTYVGEEGIELLRAGKASALLVIPEGFTDSILLGSRASLRVVKNPAERYMPVVAHHAAAVLATVVDALAVILKEEIASLGQTLRQGEGLGAMAIGALSDRIARKSYVLMERITPWPLGLRSTKALSSDGRVGLFGSVLPGLMVLMLMMISQKLLREVTEEHEDGTLASLLSTPASSVEYGLGKTLALIAIIEVGFLVLLPAGSFLFGIRWGHPLGVMMVATAFAVAASGVMMLLAGITRTSRQAEAVGLIVVLLMGLLGGSMLPIRPDKGPVAFLAALTPNRWAIDGFLASMTGKPPWAVIDESLVLFVGGLALLVLGGWALTHRVSR